MIAMPIRTERFHVSLAILAALGAALLIAGGHRASAAPEPRIVTDSWELRFEHDDPQTISVRLPNEDREALFWYMTYTVTNRTGEDRLFIPDVWLLTDAGDLLQANRRLPPAVFHAIREREANALLESPVQVVGRLLQGEDNARDGVVIWRVPDHDIKQVRIFFGGLSGEIHEVEDPETGEVRRLRKTLMLEYNTPGDVAYRDIKNFVHSDERWVVR